MQICNEFHEELVYADDRACPLCESFRERDSVIAERDETVAALSARIEELLDKIDVYRSELKI